MEKYDGPESPFDQIRQVDADGNEFWSARDMQPIMAYIYWQKFLAAIERARQALINTGEDPDVHISLTAKSVQTGLGLFKDIVDYRLSRLGAYLVAMNGDPSKPENAAAQAYFAVRTRQAELAEIPDHATALEGWAREIRAREEIRKALAEAQPKAQAYDAWLDGNGVYLVGTAAKMLGFGPNKFWDWLYAQKIVMKLPNQKRHREPYSEFIKNGWMASRPKKPEDCNGIEGYSQTYITPKGIESIRQKLIKMGYMLPGDLRIYPGGAEDGPSPAISE
jgi:DNA-damage-inducible protein D